MSPNQAWNENGTAYVAPMSPFPDLTPRTLPLENRTAGDQTVTRNDYPQGLVIIQTGHQPGTTPATLPIFASSGDSVHITDDVYVEWPDGFVVWFYAQ